MRGRRHRAPLRASRSRRPRTGAGTTSPRRPDRVLGRGCTRVVVTAVVSVVSVPTTAASCLVPRAVRFRRAPSARIASPSAVGASSSAVRRRVAKTRARLAAHPQVRDGEADEQVPAAPAGGGVVQAVRLEQLLEHQHQRPQLGELRHARLDPVHRLQPVCRADGEVQRKNPLASSPVVCAFTIGTLAVYIPRARATARSRRSARDFRAKCSPARRGRSC